MAGNSVPQLCWPPLVTKRTCEWCSSPCWMKNDQFPRLCQHPWSQWPTDLLLDLQYCEDCVVEYHRIRDDVVKNYPQNSKVLWEGDVQRLTLFITQALRPSQNEGEENQTALEVLDHFEKSQLNMDNVAQNLNVPMLEILQFPQLLFDTALAELFFKAITVLIDNGTPLILSEKYPGIYVLLVHPAQKIKKWATKTTQRLTRVSSDEYDMVKDAIQWMVGILTLNMFDNDILVMDELDVSSSAAAYLPSHLCDLKCPLEFWKGFTKLLLRMEGDVLCYKVLGVSGHRDLPDTILNAIENKGWKSLFWSAFRCLVIILERCGPRIWPMVTRQPLQVFNMITSHTVYCEELNRYNQGFQTDEQIEQGCSQDGSSSDIQRGSISTAIGWFQPFVLSVLDYGEVTVDCVTAVIQFLDKLSGQIRKREIIFNLCNIVSRVVHSGRVSSLLPTADIWVAHLVKLSSLEIKNHELFRNIVFPAQKAITIIFTKTSVNKERHPDFQNIDFSKLKSERQRQLLTEKLFDHLKGNVGILPKFRKEKDSSFHTRIKKVPYMAIPQTPTLPIPAVSEGTQTSGRQKDSLSKKDFQLKSLKVTLHDCQTNLKPANSSMCSLSSPQSPSRRSPVFPTSSFPVIESREGTSSRLSDELEPFQTANQKSSRQSMSTSSSKTPCGVMASAASDSTLSSSTTSLAKTEKTVTGAGSSKANPISLDSDEEDDQSEKEVTPEQRGIEEDKQSPSNLSPMSRSPEIQQFSIFKHRSLEKSKDRLNRIRKSENFPDISYSNASMSKESSAKTFSSASSNVFTTTQSSTSSSSVSTSNLTAFPEASLSTSSDDSSSKTADRSDSEVRIITKGNDKVRVSKHRKRTLLKKGTESSDKTASLSSDEDFQKCPRKGKKLRKKRSIKKRIQSVQISDTESLDENNDGSESEFDSDEPLQNLRTPSKNVNSPVASTSSSRTCTEKLQVKTKKFPSSSVGGSVRERITKLRGILSKARNKTCEAPKKDDEAPKKDDEANVINRKAEPIRSKRCIDDTIPPIPRVIQAEKVSTEFVQSRQEINSEKFGKFSAKRRMTDHEGGLTGKGTPERIVSNKDSTNTETSMKEVRDTKANKEAKSTYSGKTTASSVSSTITINLEDASQPGEVSLNDISRVLENDGEFNEDEWYSHFEDELLLSEDEKDNSEKILPSKEPKEQAVDILLLSDDEVGDEFLASLDIEQSVSGKRKETPKNHQESKSKSVEEFLIPEESISDEELFAAYKTGCSQNDEQEKKNQEVCSDLGKEVANEDDLTYDEWFDAPTSKIRSSSEMTNRKEVEGNVCMTVSQESTESEIGVTKFLAAMDSKYGDISSDSEEESKKTTNGVFPVSERIEEGGKTVKERVEDMDTEDIWEDNEWEDANVMCSQGSVIDSILEDTESLSSDEEQLDETQDPFSSPELRVKLGTKDLAETVNIPLAPSKDLPLPTYNPVVPSRPPAPSHSVGDARAQKDACFQEKPAVVGPSPIFKPDAMYERILSWRVSWLNARREEISLYSNIGRMEKLPKTFDSLTDYCQSFAPILVVEAWEQAIKEWKESPPKKITASVKNVNASHRFSMVNAFASNVRHSALINRTLPEESELVILGSEGCRLFGLVDKVDQEVVRDRGSFSSDVGESSERTYNIKFAIRVLRKANFRPPESSGLEITVIASMLTTLRKWCGLVNFYQSLLARDILRPRNPIYFCQSEIPKQVKASECYNESQSRVIQTAAEAVHQAYTLPRICLVQGPPGTGKSHTIVGIVSSILNHPKAQETSTGHSELFSEKPKILLCAPSNEAIDELIKKFIQAKPKRENKELNKENRRTTDKNRDPRGENYNNCGDFCVIRVGRKSKINESVKQMGLENMTRREMARRNTGPQVHSTCNIRDQLKQIEQAIDAVERKTYILSKEETATATEENQKERKLRELKSETSFLVSQKKELERSFSNSLIIHDFLPQ